MLRYKLRTLLILLATGPPMLAACWFYPRAAFVVGGIIAYELLLFLVVFLEQRTQEE